jgi:hypothetical protein
MSLAAHPVRWVSSVAGNPNLIRLGIYPKITFLGTPDTILQLTETHSQLSWPVLKRPPFNLTSVGGQLFTLPEAVAVAGYGQLLWNSDYEDYYYGVTDDDLQLSKDQLAQTVSQPAHWQSTLMGAIGRMVVDWDVPLGSGAEWAQNQSRFKVESHGALMNPKGELNFSLWETSPTNWPWLAASTIEANSRIVLLYNPVKKESLPIGMDFSDRDRESLSVYFITEHYAEIDLAEIFGDKYPIRPDSATLNSFYRAKDKATVSAKAAFRAYLHTWQNDRTAFLHAHYKEMSDWLAGARLVELRFVPEHQIYNTVTIDSVQIITPDVLPDQGP